MTREELKAHCIRQIEQIEMWAKYKGEKPSGKVYEEHKLILELLEQECCENAISREDALLILTGEDLPDDASKLISIFSERIKKLPSVKPEQKIGHWIYEKDTDKARCSRCGSLCFTDKLGRIETPFCPNCGADLREPKDGEK